MADAPLLDSDLPGFTPVRRPAHDVVDDSPANPASGAWTSARCHRILRQITSRIALLRKERQNPSAETRNAPGKTFDIRPRAVGGSSSLSSRKQNDSKGDQEWEPSQWRRKGVRRTYGKRNTQKRTAKKAQGYGLDDHSSEGIFEESSLYEASQDDHPPPLSVRDSLRRLRELIPRRQFDLYEGLVPSVQAMLRAADSSKQRVRTGTRSLFNTCLRAVPQYIDAEMRLLKEEDPDSAEDVTTSVFEEVESFAALRPTNGWKLLRDLTRAQSMWCLYEAIVDGTIVPAMGRVLALVCSAEKCGEEAMMLCSALVDTLGPLEMPWYEHASLFGPCSPVALRTLDEVAWLSSQLGSFFRLMSRLLNDKIVPVKWVSSCGMDNVWELVFRSIEWQDASCNHAMDLLITAISLSQCNSDDDRDNDCQDQLSRTIMILLGRLIAINASSCDLSIQEAKNGAFASKHARLGEKVKIPDEHRPRAKPNSLPAQVLSILLDRTRVTLFDKKRVEVPLNNWPSSRLYFNGLAMRLLVATGPSKLSENDRYFSWLTLACCHSESMQGDILDLYSDFLLITALLCDQFCERLTKYNEIQRPAVSFPFLKRITRYFLDVVIPEVQELEGGCWKPLCKVIELAAFELAERESQGERLSWALEIEEEIEAIEQTFQEKRGGVRKTKAAPSGPSFRWEESVSEWIAKTPAAKQKRRKNSRQVLQSALCRTRKKVASTNPPSAFASLHHHGQSLTTENSESNDDKNEAPLGRTAPLSLSPNKLPKKRTRSTRRRDKSPASTSENAIHSKDALVSDSDSDDEGTRRKRRSCSSRSLSTYSDSHLDSDDLDELSGHGPRLIGATMGGKRRSDGRSTNTKSESGGGGGRTKSKGKAPIRCTEALVSSSEDELGS